MPSYIRGSDNFDSTGGNAVKAWVNFNGTGTVSIRASFNVSSITDNGTGDYTVNFTTAMSDANYGFGVAGSDTSTTLIAAAPRTNVPTTTALRMMTFTTGGVPTDVAFVCASIFR